MLFLLHPPAVATVNYSINRMILDSISKRINNCREESIGMIRIVDVVARCNSVFLCGGSVWGGCMLQGGGAASKTEHGCRRRYFFRYYSVDLRRGRRFTRRELDTHTRYVYTNMDNSKQSNTSLNDTTRLLCHSVLSLNFSIVSM